ncbi:hypothetical protein PYJP_12230 [Pyrofollis japonicus]|uniref:helix-turn-helix domain-containing protein n=1 Tax=Pyrofollis japonicus TaxID=3060460 RepID=UPI00295C3A03|nr:helix-turn-helix domain-containing protein [Pyrofollis japonicus]BEP17871.1 hypothetical protein PYJP_12230 [Pyrofollis japonicus]
MPKIPAVVIASTRPTTIEECCYIQQLILRAENMCDTLQASCRLGRSGAEIEYPLLVAQILYASRLGDLVEGWIRIQGEPQALDALETVLKRDPGISFQTVSEAKQSLLLKTLMPPEKWCGGCKLCPYIDALPNTMPLNIVVTSNYIVVVLVASRPSVLKSLEDLGYKVLDTIPVEEVAEALTSKQEIALMLAYLYGYYENPRRISIRELASKLGMSGSALAELLRKAEQRIIKNYVVINLAHHLYITLRKPVKEKNKD